VQSSDDARKPSGMAAINKTRSQMRGCVVVSDVGAARRFATPVVSAAMTSNQKGAADHQLISREKSIAKRISSIAEIANPTLSNHCSSLFEPTIISALNRPQIKRI